MVEKGSLLYISEKCTGGSLKVSVDAQIKTATANGSAMFEFPNSLSIFHAYEKNDDKKLLENYQESNKVSIRDSEQAKEMNKMAATVEYLIPKFFNPCLSVINYYLNIILVNKMQTPQPDRAKYFDKTVNVQIQDFQIKTEVNNL